MRVTGEARTAQGFADPGDNWRVPCRSTSRLKLNNHAGFDEQQAACSALLVPTAFSVLPIAFACGCSLTGKVIIELTSTSSASRCRHDIIGTIRPPRSHGGAGGPGSIVRK